MILREATIKYAGYDPNNLTSSSAKRVCCVCDECGRVRWAGKAWYNDLCHKCACNTDKFKKASRDRQLGHKASKETRNRMSTAHKKRYEDPEERRKTREATIYGKQKLLKNPEYIKILNKINKNISDRAIERYKDPKMREKARISALKRYEDPLEHIKSSAAQQGISIEEWKDFSYNKLNHYGVSNSDYDIWRHKIYDRDNHTCRICGNYHCMIHAHHIIPQRINQELILVINNGVTMCKTCHELTYGREEIFIEELQMIVNDII